MFYHISTMNSVASSSWPLGYKAMPAELIDPTDIPEITSYIVSSLSNDLTNCHNAPASNAPFAPPPAKARE